MNVFIVYAMLLAALPLCAAPIRFGLPGKNLQDKSLQDKVQEPGQQNTLQSTNENTDQRPESVGPEAFNAAVSAIIDCTGAAISCAYSPTGVVLPSTTVSMDSASGLPQRIAFFLADPSDYISAMESVAVRDGNLLLSLKNLITKVSEDPLLTASYITMQRKGYQPMDYIISGNLFLIYPDDMTAQKLIDGIMETRPSEQPVLVAIDLSVLGNKLAQPVSVAGIFSIRINPEHNLDITPVGDYMVNGIKHTAEVSSAGSTEALIN